MVGLEDGSNERHTSEGSCNSSLSLQKLPGVDEAQAQDHVGGKNNVKIPKQEQPAAVVKEVVQEDGSKRADSSIILEAKKVEKKAEEEVLKLGEEDDGGVEEEAAIETKVDYRNDTQISTKEKKEKNVNLEGNFGVLPPQPPSNVEVHYISNRLAPYHETSHHIILC